MRDFTDPLAAQVGVLGSILISDEIIGEVLTKVRPEDFLNEQARTVFCAIRSVFNAGVPVDPITVRDKLGGDAQQWSDYLMALMDQTPTAANIWEYVRIMRSQAALYRMRELGEQLQEARDRETAERIIAKLNGLLAERQDVKRMNMTEMLLDFMRRHSEPHEYLTWGVDKLNHGLYAEAGDMIVLGGSPSSGKTALACNFAWHMAEKRRVGFYSLETSRYKLADRLMSNLANLDMSEIKRGEIPEEDWRRIADPQQCERIRKRELTLIEASGMTMSDIQADALAHRYEVIYLDYLQIVQPENSRENRQNQVGQISRDIQRLAHSNGITAVALSQFSRLDDEEPTMSDLRESGQIEQDADIIMLLYLEEPQRREQSRRILKIGKNKEGTMGRVYLVFDGEHQRFRESVLDGEVPAPKAKPYKRKKRSQLDLFSPADDGPPIPDPFEAKEGSK